MNLGFRIAGAAQASLARARRSRAIQEHECCAGLVQKAQATRFGRDHRFERIDSVAAFQRAVPIRTYEALWERLLARQLPRL